MSDTLKRTSDESGMPFVDQEKRREQEALHPRPKYGAERLLMTAAPGVDWDRLVLATAMKGHLGDQKAVLVFKEGEPDGSAVKSSFMAKGDLGDIHNNLLGDRLAFHILESVEGGALVHVVDTDGSLRDAVLKSAQRYDAEVDTRQGRAEFIGTTKSDGTDREQRDDARKVYEGVIRSSPVQNAVGLWHGIHNRWSAALAHEEAVGGPFLGAEATTTFEPCPQEGFVRRLMFHWCNNDLRAGRTESSFEVNGGRLAEDEMRRLVAYAKRHGFLR